MVFAWFYGFPMVFPWFSHDPRRGDPGVARVAPGQADRSLPAGRLRGNGAICGEGGRFCGRYLLVKIQKAIENGDLMVINGY